MHPQFFDPVAHSTLLSLLTEEAEIESSTSSSYLGRTTNILSRLVSMSVGTGLKVLVCFRGDLAFGEAPCSQEFLHLLLAPKTNNTNC